MDDEMNVDQLIEWAEDHAREALLADHPLSIEKAQASIAYSLLAIAKMQRSQREG